MIQPPSILLRIILSSNKGHPPPEHSWIMNYAISWYEQVTTICCSFYSSYPFLLSFRSARGIFRLGMMNAFHLDQELLCIPIWWFLCIPVGRFLRIPILRFYGDKINARDEKNRGCFREGIKNCRWFISACIWSDTYWADQGESDMNCCQGCPWEKWWSMLDSDISSR